MVLRRFRKKKDMPSGLWVKCPDCGATLFSKELQRNNQVCGECNHHFRSSGPERIRLTADHESFVEESPDLYPTDRLGFVDSKSYPDRIRQAIEKTGRPDAALYGVCTIQGLPVVLCVLDFDFVGGSMGAVVGEKVTRAIELGTKERLPVIVISSSGGARMQEGAISLMQMGKTSAAISRHSESGGLYISVLTNPTTGGVMASFAALGDVVVAEPNALIGFAGPRVIQETLRQTLPEGFQRSEFLMERGFVDRIIHRGEMRDSLAQFISYLWNYDDGMVKTEEEWEPPRLGPDDEKDEDEEGADIEKATEPNPKS